LTWLVRGLVKRGVGIIKALPPKRQKRVLARADELATDMVAPCRPLEATPQGTLSAVAGKGVALFHRWVRGYTDSIL
jgi:hypothetical protein